MHMTDMVFDKTDKGREEIATRKYQLSSRMRALLVLVDGKQSTQELLKKVSGIGLDEASIIDLQKNGFIRPAADASPKLETPGPAPSPALPASPIAPLDEALLPEGQNQYQAIYSFYTQTIRNMIGLRGYGLQLKVEKAASIEDFRKLRQPYLEAVLKAQGSETARSLRHRLDQLLYLGESPPQSTITGAPDGG